MQHAEETVELIAVIYANVMLLYSNQLNDISLSFCHKSNFLRFYPNPTNDFPQLSWSTNDNFNVVINKKLNQMQCSN